MKKFTLITVCIVCSLNFMLQAQIKIDASFYSEALDATKKVDIYLPNDYYTNLETKHPVIYYLHGANGDQNESYQYALHYFVTHAENPLADSMPAAIIVSPDGSCDPYLGSFWLNSELYGNYEDYVISDLIPFIESEFRVMPEKDFRFVTGYSMGGFGSAYLGLKHPDIFRACAPMSAAHISYPDTLMNRWINWLYEENGDYHFNYSAGNITKLFFTVSGGFSPNMENPYFIEMLWDTSGNIVDTIWSKWLNYDCSNLVSNLTSEQNISFFLICGTEDKYLCYPPYLQFADSLEKYDIDYKYSYSAYDHGDIDPEANATMWRWIDSLAYDAYQHDGIEDHLINIQATMTVYPNPVRETTNISFKLYSPEYVSINVYNQKGELIQELPDKLYTTGLHEIHINTENIPAGLYYFQFKSGKQIVSRKVVKL